MKNRFRVPLVAALVVAATPIAYWLGRATVPAGSHDDESPARPPKRLAGVASLRAGTQFGPFLRREVETRGGRSFKEVVSHLRSTITSSDFSDPEIAASILMLRQLSAEETGKLIGQLNDKPLAGVSPTRRDSIRDLLLENWGRLDHEAALAYAEEQQTEQQRGDMLRSIVSGWAQSNPSAARAYVTEFGERSPQGSKLAASITFEIYKQWALLDAAAVMSSLPSLKDETLRQAALGGITNLLKLPDRRDEILQFIEQIPEKDVRDKAVLAAATKLEPAASARWIEGMGELPPESREQIRRYLTDRWSQSDPRAAGDWLLRTARESERAQVITNVVKWWTMADTNAAAEWVVDIGLGPETDGAIGYIVRGVSQIDRQAGFDWALHITSRDERIRRLTDSLRYLQLENIEAARRQLDEAGIREEEAAAVLERFSDKEPILAE